MGLSFPKVSFLITEKIWIEQNEKVTSSKRRLAALKPDAVSNRAQLESLISWFKPSD